MKFVMQEIGQANEVNKCKKDCAWTLFAFECSKFPEIIGLPNLTRVDGSPQPNRADPAKATELSNRINAERTFFFCKWHTHVPYSRVSKRGKRLKATKSVKPKQKKKKQQRTTQHNIQESASKCTSALFSTPKQNTKIIYLWFTLMQPYAITAFFLHSFCSVCWVTCEPGESKCTSISCEAKWKMNLF